MGGELVCLRCVLSGVQRMSLGSISSSDSCLYNNQRGCGDV